MAGLFLVALVFAPVATAIPGYATAPAIIFVGCVMARALRHVEWDDLTEGVPAIATAIAMPFTYSIATGIGLGFISYTVIKLLVGTPPRSEPGRGHGGGAVRDPVRGQLIRDVTLHVPPFPEDR